MSLTFDVQLHWNNVQRAADVVDSSGMTIFYTSSLRSYTGEVLMVGQTSLEIPPAQPSVIFSGRCSSNCTSPLPQPIYVAEAILHMHLLGTTTAVSVSFRMPEGVCPTTRMGSYARVCSLGA